MTSQMVDVRRTIWFACGASLLLTALGCGAKLPIVSGTVTLDGQPLAEANVIFMPGDEIQSPAQGTTDASGNYTLEQEAGIEGVQPGEYSVRITTYQPGSQDLDPPVPTVKERVPMRYNLTTELNAVVGGDDQATTENPFDFKLESGGQIFHPPPDAF